MTNPFTYTITADQKRELSTLISNPNVPELVRNNVHLHMVEYSKNHANNAITFIKQYTN